VCDLRHDLLLRRHSISLVQRASRYVYPESPVS
jgi:hypothetical protein